MTRSPHARWWAMGATALTLLVVGLDMTVLNVALPTIAVDLHASSSQLQWFVDAYTLVMSAMLLPAGMLGDRYGRKRLTVASLGVFGVGSLWCAYAGSASGLVAARALLGLGSAVLIPLAMSAAVVLFEPDERPRAVMILGMSTMVGLPLGPVLAGVLLQHFWWGSVFLVNVPVVVFALVAVAVCLPETRGERDRPIDWVGVVASGLGLLGVTYGVIEGPERGWTDPLTLLPLVGGAVVLAGFLVWERRQRHAVPVFDYAVWADPTFRWGAVGATVASLAMFGLMFVTPQYFRAVLGSDALGTGLRTLPMVAGLLVGMRGTMLLARRFRARTLAATGFALTAVGLATGATTNVESGFARCALWTATVGLGFGMALFASQNQALMSLPRRRAASGSALIQAMRQSGSVLGIAALGAILNATYRSRISDLSVPDGSHAALADSPQAGITVAERLADPGLIHGVRSAFVHGMDATLWASAAVAVLGAVAMWWLLPGDVPAPASREPATDAAESAHADVATDSPARV
jgi:DHA2 family multidrug resistance protein-like MFS transporter